MILGIQGRPEAPFTACRALVGAVRGQVVMALVLPEVESMPSLLGPENMAALVFGGSGVMGSSWVRQ